MGSTVIIAIKHSGGQVQFEPSTETAPEGATIYWRNEDHQAHWPGPLPPAAPNSWLTYQIPGTVPGQPPAVSDGVAFGATGTYPYRCELHHHETGTLEIQ